MGNSTLFCQLDTGAYASVIKTTQLRQIAPNAPIKKTKKTLVSYSQHQIKPKGYVNLPVRFKEKELNVNFYVIDSKQKPLLSGKVCQAEGCHTAYWLGQLYGSFKSRWQDQDLFRSRRPEQSR